MRLRGRALFLVVALGVLTLFSYAMGAAFPATVRIPPREPRQAPALPAATFSHRAHGAFGCFACHPSVFPQALVGFSHEDMRAGRYCGRCHDGVQAFAVEKLACGGCHAPTR